MALQQLDTVAALRAQVRAWRQAGDRIALVPTMGNLHEGHLQLVRQARARASRVVVSIFVNPTQFGANEDFGRYPRTLTADCQALASVAADAVFVPSVDEMYPLGQAAVRVEVPALSGLLCGAHRPGHFAGVASVVALLFNLVQPDVALFGEKDYQQLAVIRQMAQALGFPLEIVGVPTEREASGLALSSRNQYLSAHERTVSAPRIHQALQRATDRLKEGDRDFAAIEIEGGNTLSAAGFRVDYFAVRAPDLSEPRASMSQFVVLTAARLGATRLIDNLST